MTDIIQDAKRLLEGATPGTWEHYDDGGIVSLASGDTAIATDLNPWDADLIDAAPELAQALAEETWEHRHEYRAADDQQWYALTPWAEGEPDCRPWNVTPTRIVRRRVSKPELVNEAN